MTTDHKGYKVKDSMDWQDRLVLWSCVVTVTCLAVLMLGGWV